MDNATNAKKTPFYDQHVALHAKLVPFAGFWMPIQYTGIMDEHRRVRTTVGVFDVTHMGEFIVKGENAEKFLNAITINDVTKLAVGRVQYSAMCYPGGGIVDDLLVYRFADHYMLVVNASNLEKDFNWINGFLSIRRIPSEDGPLYVFPHLDFFPEDIQIENISDSTALLAIQGPQALEALQPLTDVNLNEIEFYHFREGKIAGISAILSRTGYTGEIGLEIYHQPADSAHLWEAIFAASKSYDIQPIGLGARDTLRLELKYCLYGNDIDQTTNPLEAGLAWITKLDKPDFVGKAALLKIKAAGLPRKSVGFEMLEPGIPRHGYRVFNNGKEIGQVTSGTQSPTLNKGIGVAYVATEFSPIGTQIDIEIRGKFMKAVVVNTPFVAARTQ
ncbi:MAG: glycine cleavage system aminomethyltransferase GcvT [Candidatus Neomarinimicrobiota bacterium]